MKKFLYPALALSALALASCSSEEPVAGNGDSVTFNVTIPGSLSSRATLGDQILAPVDNLQWTVYEVNGETKTAVYTASFEGTPFAGGKTTETVTLNLGKGKTYQVVFYADNAANGAVSFTNGVLSVDYDAMATNTLAEDAFVGTSEAVVAGDPTNTVQLIRPFAQLNWGTSDLNDPVVAKYINPADGVTALTAQVTVTGTLYKSFDVISNTFSDEVTDATFGAVTAADFSAYETDGQKVTFPAVGGTETYSLLAMNYLMPGTQGTATCTLAFNNGFESVEVNSVTLKQNFRTNIYGALLTNPTEFNVQIAPAFEEGDNNVEYTQPIEVTTPEEFVSTLANAKDGDIISLANDMNFAQSGAVTIDKDITLTVPEGVTVTTARQGSTANIIVAEGTTVTMKGNGTISGDNRLVDVDGTLNIDGPTFTTSTATRGSAITVNPGATVNFDSGTLECAFYAFYVEGNFTMNGGTVKSTSANNAPGANNQYAYAINIFNPSAVAVFNGGYVEGVQGAVAASYGNTTINGGTYVVNPLYGATSAFYDVYNAGNGNVVINGGNFYSDKNTVYFGGAGAGKIELRGGKYNNQGYNPVLGEGFEWKAITDGNYTWEVVPAGN